MRLYLIARIIRTDMRWATHYRVYDYESGEIRDVAVKDLIAAMEKHKKYFKNAKVDYFQPVYDSGYTEKSIKINKGEDTIPTLDRYRTFLRGPSHVIVNIDEENGLIDIVDYNGNKSMLIASEAYKMRGSVYLPVKYRSRKLEPKPKGWIKVRNTREHKVTEEFVGKTKEEYRKFKLKCAALGVDQSFRYSIHGKDVRLEKYRGKSKNATIPGFITVIGAGAFKEKELETVAFSEGLERIEKDAFYKNNLQKVELPGTLTRIGDGAFYKNKIRELKLPNTLRIIEDVAFAHNRLIELEIPESVQYIGEWAFRNNLLEKVEFKGKYVRIEKRAFKDNKVTIEGIDLDDVSKLYL